MFITRVKRSEFALKFVINTSCFDLEAKSFMEIFSKFEKNDKIRIHLNKVWNIFKINNIDCSAMTSSALGWIEINNTGSKLTFACSKSTTETLE